MKAKNREQKFFNQCSAVSAHDYVWVRQAWQLHRIHPCPRYLHKHVPNHCHHCTLQDTIEQKTSPTNYLLSLVLSLCKQTHNQKTCLQPPVLFRSSMLYNASCMRDLSLLRCLRDVGRTHDHGELTSCSSTNELSAFDIFAAHALHRVHVVFVAQSQLTD